jgi:hypothetical protein
MDAAFIRDTGVRRTRVLIVTIPLLTRADALVVTDIALSTGVAIPARVTGLPVDVLTAFEPVTGVRRAGITIGARDPITCAQA